MSDHVYHLGERVWCVIGRTVRTATVIGYRQSERVVGSVIRQVVHGYDMKVEWHEDRIYPVESYPVGRALVWPTKQDALRALAVVALRGTP